MIDFNTFVTTANQLTEAQKADAEGIVLDEKAEGRLGTHKVVVKEPTKEEQQLIQKTKDELTQSLCKRFNVNDRAAIPKDVLVILDLVDKSDNVLAKDVIKLNEQVERYEKQEKFLNEEFAKAVEDGNKEIDELLVKCGCSKYFGIPKNAPLEQALNALVDKTAKLWFAPGTSTTALENHGKNIVNMLKNDIKDLLTQAFGEDSNGPLALKLKGVIAQVNATGAKQDLFPKLVETVNGYFLPGQKVTLPKANSEVVAPNVPPAGDVDLNSSKSGDLEAEYDRLMDDFAKRAVKFVGDDAAYILSKDSPLGKKLRKVADNLMVGDKALTTTVGKLREKVTEAFEKLLGPEGFPSELAKDLQEAYLDPRMSDGQRRMKYAFTLSRAVHKGDPNVVKLANRDLLAASVAEIKGGHPVASRQIEWFLANKADDAEVLDKLVAHISADSFVRIEELAMEHGCPNLSDGSIENFLNKFTFAEILEAVRTSDPKLLDKPGVLLYLQQRTSSAPVDYRNGNAVYRSGDWLSNRELGEKIFKCAFGVKPAAEDGPGEVGREQSVLTAQYAKTLDDLRAALNPKKGGGFKTAPAKTKGQLSIDDSGRIRSHNRHFGSHVPMTPLQNLTFKLAILDSFRALNQRETDFLDFVRESLGIGTLDQGKPVSRAALKAIFLAYDEMIAAKNDGGRVEDPAVQPEETDVATSRPSATGPVDVPHVTNLNDAWKEPFAIMKRLLRTPGVEKTSFAAFGPDDAPIDLILKTKELVCPNSKQGSDLYDGSVFKFFPDIYSKMVCEAVNKIRGGGPIEQQDVNSALLVAKTLSDPIADPDERFTRFAAGFVKMLSGKEEADLSNDDIAIAKLVLMQGLVKIRFSEAEKGNFDRLVMSHGLETMKTENWSFGVNGKVFTSSFTPCAEIGKSNKTETGGRTTHLSGFISSRLLDNAGKPIVTCLRFGEFSCHGAEKKEREALYSELIEQAFLNNPDLVDSTLDGDTVDLPLMRLDLAGYEKLDTPPDEVKLTFTRPGDDSPRTVTLRPKVEHFCLPIDSLGDPNNGNLMTKSEIRRNLDAWNSLGARARSYDGANKALVNKLVAQIDAYMRELFGDGNADSVKPFLGFGAELTRLAGRLGALDALIGGVPAVNGYSGRDRTGVVDNEIKMLTVNLRDPNYVLPEIRQNGAEDPDSALRTKMLVGTGNNAIGHQITLSSSPINLDGHEDSGLAGLFKTDELKPTQLDNVSIVPKTEHEVAKELLGVGKATVKDVPRDGNCFFHAIVEQMTDDEKTEFGDPIRLRARMIADVDDLERRINVSDDNRLPGVYKSEGEYFAKNNVGGNDGDVVITEGFKLARQPRFGNSGVYADMGQGAFIATMLKRPVYVVSQTWDNGMKSGEPGLQVFNRDLRTGQAFDENAKPIYLYYDRTGESSGHFRAIEVEEQGDGEE